MSGKPEAAKLTEHEEQEHANIVHSLRSQGVERWVALEKAERLMAERIARRAELEPKAKT